MFYVYRLDNESLQTLEENHKLFQQYVGTHIDYDENGKRSFEGMKDKSTHHLYYNRKIKHPDNLCDENKVIGRFKIAY